MDLELRDLTVLITGASGGIGRALARTFGREGARLVLQGHSRADELEAFVEQEGLADRCLIQTVDVRDASAVDSGMDAAVQRFGRVDVAIANAGVWPVEDLALDELSPERVRETLEVNLMGSMWTLRSWMRQLRAKGPREDGRAASAVLIGSTAARFGERFHADYATAKAGLGGLLQSVKNELPLLDPFARVNRIEPGWTATEMARAALDDPVAVGRAVRTMPLRQIGSADDVASAALFFASPRMGRHVTGQTLTVAGGMEGRVLWEPGEIDAAEARERGRPRTGS